LGNGHIAAMNAIYQVLDERHHQKTLISRREICYIDPAVLELLVCCSFCFFNNFSRFLFHLIKVCKDDTVYHVDLFWREIFVHFYPS